METERERERERERLSTVLLFVALKECQGECGTGQTRSGLQPKQLWRFCPFLPRSEASPVFAPEKNRRQTKPARTQTSAQKHFLTAEWTGGEQTGKDRRRTNEDRDREGQTAKQPPKQAGLLLPSINCMAV